MLNQTQYFAALSLLLIACVACSPAVDSRFDGNKQAVRRMLEGMDQGNFAIFDEVLSPEVVVHFPGGTLDRTETEEMARSFYTAFPDLSHTVEDLLAVGDRVVLRATDRGTHRGEFQGIPPTGRQVEFGVIAIYRFVDGRIVEIWEQGDLLGLTEQLGAEKDTQ